jgi:hypothetical protein
MRLLVQPVAVPSAVAIVTRCGSTHRQPPLTPMSPPHELDPPCGPSSQPPDSPMHSRDPLGTERCQ